MPPESLDALLVLSLLGALVAIVAVMVLKRSCPVSSSAYRELFVRGTIPPYNSITSLSGRFVLFWKPMPNLSDCPPLARRALVVARGGFAIASLALLMMIALGFREHLV